MRVKMLTANNYQSEIMEFMHDVDMDSDFDYRLLILDSYGRYVYPDRIDMDIIDYITLSGDKPRYIIDNDLSNSIIVIFEANWPHCKFLKNQTDAILKYTSHWEDNTLYLI